MSPVATHAFVVLCIATLIIGSVYEIYRRRKNRKPDPAPTGYLGAEGEYKYSVNYEELEQRVLVHEEIAAKESQKKTSKKKSVSKRSKKNNKVSNKRKK